MRMIEVLEEETNKSLQEMEEKTNKNEGNE